MAGAATDLSIKAAIAKAGKPEQREALAKAGSVLRRLRESAGLTIDEVGTAINLEDPELLRLAESGKAALPFELILRLASVLGRNDPIPFVTRLTRTYSPDVWRTLEGLGIGRLAVQAGREREFANLYRGSDAARRLSDDEFTRVTAFLEAGLEMALAFREASGPAARRKRGAR
jgi:transcriptional regulator with XRE-family HTH domain